MESLDIRPYYRALTSLSSLTICPNWAKACFIGIRGAVEFTGCAAETDEDEVVVVAVGAVVEGVNTGGRSGDLRICAGEDIKGGVAETGGGDTSVTGLSAKRALENAL